VRLNTKVTRIDVEKKAVHIGEKESLPFDYLVFATGAKALLPPIPGVGEEGCFTLKNLVDGRNLKAYLKEKNCRSALIVGAGFIALEMAEAFVTLGLKTTLVHRGELPASRWDGDLAKVMLAELTAQGVDFLPRRHVLGVEKRGKSLVLVMEEGEIAGDLVLFALGVKPAVELAKEAGIRLGVSGAVAVNFHQETNVAGIYAVGDCSETFHRVSRRWVNMPLGDVANKQGRLLGRHLSGEAAYFPGVVGAQSFKLFKLEAAATGIDEKEALSVGFDPVSTLIWGNAIGSAMPGLTQVALKLIADKGSGMLLGCQAVGQKGAVSRVNVVSAALWRQATVDDLAFLDLAYAPPFGAAWDPLHIAAQNLMKLL